MNYQNTLSLLTPASWHGDMWREGLPCGNGTLGAMVYGNIADETILINHSHLRHWGEKSPLPDISTSLQEARALIDAGKFMEANWVSSNRLKEEGYMGKLFTPCPLCDIKLETDTLAPFHNYSRTLSMDTGEVVVCWDEEDHHFERHTFVSRTEDILGILIKGTRKISIKLSVSLHETFSADTKKMKEECADTLESFIQDSYVYYAVTNDDSRDFGAVLRVITDGALSIEESTTLVINDASQITILGDFFIQEDRQSAFLRLSQKLSHMDDGYDVYLKKHILSHSKLFHSCDLSFSEVYQNNYNEEILLDIYKGNFSKEVLEKLWRFGRYLLISGTKDTPFPLYGIWGGRYNLMWSHNMANENLQMMYWHVLTGGLAYTLVPVIDYYTDLLGDYQENAKKLFGLAGIYVPAGSSPGMGLPNQIVPVIMNWIGAAGWLAQHFYNYYLYTEDMLLLKQKILPFMEKALQFYEEYLVLDSNGYYKIYPSVSPENSPKNFFTEPVHERMPHICPSVINATMDFAIIKELLSNMISISEEQRLYPEKLPNWRQMLTHIPPYETNEDGAIKEWMHPFFQDRYTHRHISHIYPVFPGTEYVVGRDDKEILTAFETAVNKRVLGSQTGWSFAHMASIYARFEKGEAALDCLKTLAKSCLLNNFMTLHNDWRRMGLTMNLGNGNTAPMQLDANMGIVNAIQEMLLFVSKDLIKILPACPELLDQGSVRGFRFCTGEIDFTWNQPSKTFKAQMHAKRDTNLSLVLPDLSDQYQLHWLHSDKKRIVASKELVSIHIEKETDLIITHIEN